MNSSGLKIALLLSLGFPLLNSYADPPDTLWTNTFGSAGNDVGIRVRQTSGSGFIIAGYTKPPDSTFYQGLLVKTDPYGEESWTRHYAGTGDLLFHDVQITSDGGFICTGLSNSLSGINADLCLLKTDSCGIEQWRETFGGNSDDKGHAVQQTDDGGYIIAGETTSLGAGNRDFLLVKTDEIGSVRWYRTFGGSQADYCHAVCQTGDGGYLMAGSTASFGSGGYDFWLVKTDAAGIEQWNRTFGGLENDFTHSMQLCDDGGIALAGCTWSFGSGGCDFWLVKTGNNGDLEWSNAYGGYACDCCYSLQQTIDGGFILSGWCYSFGAGECDFWMVKTDYCGIEEWNLPVGGSGFDHGQCIQQIREGGYIATGHTNSLGAGALDVWLVRLADPSLNIICNPISTPVVIPYTGGTIEATAALSNNTALELTFDLWAEVILPGGSIYGPTVLLQNRTIPPAYSIIRQLSQEIPASAPPGFYRYFLHTGLYPDSIISTASFPFTKDTCNSFLHASDPLSNSSAYNQLIPAQPEADDNRSHLNLSCFSSANSTTTIQFELPSAGQVMIEIYNILGENCTAGIIELCRQSWYSAGKHQVNIDGTNLSSGVYIVNIHFNGMIERDKLIIVN
ncbi:hypothetical protein CEE37_10395 [candidate division LCP-89 bacterium B3_LCP]|uniref:Secretion system C-terminal sorting domain-containing protein n=1 Tax=candidate division LCP-89 bacterium B3_LCP TaxID=2012998 RepID=A0A532UYX3_UNCL8|nr:MAG: hypothetical protein CEE37_10395 [candidate division LCP-89 bacterium B3_LCP]